MPLCSLFTFPSRFLVKTPLTTTNSPIIKDRLTGDEGDDRGWDGWMASLTRWTWVSVNSGSWWWTGRPGVLRFMGSQRVGHDWATELNWTEQEKDKQNFKNLYTFHININISYKRVTSTQFSKLFLCLLFLKNSQPKKVLMPKRHTLGGGGCEILLTLNSIPCRNMQLFTYIK